MIKVDIKGIDKLTKRLSAIEKKQLPFATMTALNETAKDVKRAEDKKIKRVFKHPTKTTQNSVIILFAKKTRLEATVKIKDKPFSGSNVSVSDYLYPQIHGGRRMRKGSEKRLQSANKMAKGKSLFPGQGVKLNRFGNIPKGHMTRIMSAIGGHQKTRLNTTARSKTRNKKVTGFFVANKTDSRTSHLHPGIYKRTGRNIKPIITFGKRPHYPVRFKFYDVARKVIGMKLTRNFSKALDRALRTAK